MPLCDEDTMEQLAAALQSGDAGNLELVDEQLKKFPEDPRLHFLRGSLLAARKQPMAAHAALSRAVELAPDYHIARYQLGFFELTSGEPDAALATWGPLHRLPAENYLRIFAEGMIHLVRDEFEAAIARFDEGIRKNDENEALNSDIRLLKVECEKLAKKAGRGEELADEDTGLSATSLLLGGFSGGDTQH